MRSDQVVTLQEVFDYMQDVARQSKLIIEDAAEALRRETKCYFTHMRAWDYATKPNDHFLETQFAISRAWVTFVPEGSLSLAVLFYTQFYHGRYPVVPALMYGSLDAGTGRGFGKIDRWAPYRVIMDVEQGKDIVRVEHDGPISIVTSKRENCFLEARLIRVPLESIASWKDLQHIVVRPLAALVRGEASEAKELLEDIKTIPWPVRYGGVADQEEEEEPEQV